MSAEPHPNADKLKGCQVSDGVEQFQVVCGALNTRVSIKIPFAKIGAVLRSDFKLKIAKLHQVESFGMLCSAAELGLSNYHSSLLEFPASAPIGVDVREFLDLDDHIIDVDLTTNRSDCLSVVELAHEVGVLNKMDVIVECVSAINITIEDTLPVNVVAAETCPRYFSRVVCNVNVAAVTPL